MLKTLSNYKIDLLLIAAAAIYISILWLSLPLFQSSGGIALWHTGYADSLIKGEMFTYPQHISQPTGAPIVFGASLVYIQGVIGLLTQMSGLTAYSIVGLLFSYISTAGCYIFARQFGTSKPLSIIFATIYLSQVFFSVHVISYGATGYGFALIPTFCAFTVWAFDQSTSHKFSINSIILTLIFSVFLVFLDGYTFVMAALCSLAITSGCILTDKRNLKRYLEQFSIFLVSYAFAVCLYKLYTPSETNVIHPIGIFGILAVDINSLIWPTKGYSLLYDALGLSVTRNTEEYRGAGLGNHESVFLSASGILLALVGLCNPNFNRIKVAALIMIIMGVLMALGPIGAQRTLIDSPEQIASIAKYPAYNIYQIPGLDQMRATYRWIAVVKTGLWILACIGCQYIGKYLPGRISTILIGTAVTLFFLETTTSPLKNWERGVQNHKMANQLKNELSSELKKNIPAGSKVLFLRITNDFVIHSVAAEADIFTYNVANDKNLSYAIAVRPPEITNIIKIGPCFQNDIRVAYNRGLVDFIAIRLFDSHRGRYGWKWPPSKEERDDNLEYANNVLWHLAANHAVSQGAYFYYIDLSKITLDDSPSQCNQSP